MKELNIYLESGIKGPRRRNGIVGYVIEWKTEKGPVTLTNFVKFKDVTENRAILCGIAAALSRINEKCILNIYTSSNYLYLGFEIEKRVQKWKESAWKNSQGQEVKNRDKWEETLDLLNGNLYKFRLNEKNEYSLWLIRETVQRQAALKEEEK